MNAARTVRIGGAAAHWMDSVDAVAQLVRANVDYIMLDYLSEGALSVFARMAQMDPASGFPPDFATNQVGPCLADIMARGIKIIANAGGVNPDGCAQSIRDAAAKMGLAPRIAIVRGDNLTDRAGEFRDRDLREMFDGRAFPKERLLCANAYLGAFPIADALRAGADIVITGRVSDSAMALGPLIKEFGWTRGDHDLLSAGTLAGHLLECGCHATGGTFTDWQDVADGWADMGFPIAECRADGSFVFTKPENTGGLVSVGSVAEQMLYEVSDPQAYIVADVVCDFSGVTMKQAGRDRILVEGAKGYPPTGFYKLSVASEAGWRGFLASPIVGFDAADKARRQGEAIVTRVSRLLKERNLPPFTGYRVDAIGAGDTLGERAVKFDCREVVLRVTVDHPDRAGAELFVREQNMAMTSMAVGTTVAMAMNAQPLTAVSSYLVPREEVTVSVALDGEVIAEEKGEGGNFDPAMIVRSEWPALLNIVDNPTTVPLIQLAWARSGDKGGTCNIGVIARRPEFLPYIAATLTESAVARWFAHCFDDPGASRVMRYFVPGVSALNFVLPNSLGGSATESDRLDPFAKTMGQQLLAMPVTVPAALAEPL